MKEIRSNIENTYYKVVPASVSLLVSGVGDGHGQLMTCVRLHPPDAVGQVVVGTSGCDGSRPTGRDLDIRAARCTKKTVRV